MSEMKRVTLTTIGDVVKKSPFGGSGADQNTENFFSGAIAGGSAAASTGSGPKGGNSSSGKERKTVRLELELFEPTTKSFPEFNYSKLVREEQKRQRKLEKKTPTSNGFLSDADGDDDVARIARELEKKYGSGTAYSSTGKFAKPSQLDYCDRGAGYDEEDSFIDNTEAYDELIPQEVETVGGGFYINSGQLEFKTLSNFERPEDALRMPKPKKRVLSSSSDSSEPEEEESKSKAKKKDELAGSTGTSEAESAAGKGGSKVGRKRLNGHVEKKQKVGDEKKNAKSMTHKEGKKKKEPKDMNSAVVAAAGVGGKEMKVIKTTTVKDMLRAKRDSLRKMEQEKKGRSSGTASSSEAEEDNEEGGEDDGDEDESDSSDSGSSESGSDESDSESATASETDTKVNGETEAKKVLDAVKLPDNLPDHLLQDLTSLKEIAKNVNGKLNYFDMKVADLLLQIDVSSRMCGGNARNSIYKHLEAHLQVSRQTLMVKIKKIRIRKEENKVKKALEKLEDAVSEMMPRVITNYEMEKQKSSELRNLLLAAGDGTEKPDVKTPKKKFPWNEQVRGLLYDVANIRKQSFHILRPRKETEEEYIHSYLKKYVVPLWPSGWIKFEDLQKELDRRKKTTSKSANGKEIKKAVQLPPSTTSSDQTQTLANGPTSKQETVLPPSTAAGSSKTEERKMVRAPPQSSPAITVNTSQPPPSTSPAATKKTYNHSIINIISSPPSKSSSHSSNVLLQQPPRPQSQPHRPAAGATFDEEFLQTHVINLETAHNSTKKSPPITSTSSTLEYLPKDLRINSPALSSASSTSSSRRPSSYQEQPPVAHSTPPNAHASSSRKNRNKSRDEDSDSSIEIIGEYSVAEKSADPLNLALPTLNKDKYKKIGNSSKAKHGSGSSSSPGIGSAGVSINNNMDKAKFSAAAAAVSAGGFALPSMAALVQDMKKNPNVVPRMASAPGELDVIRIMKELQELQAIQMSSINKAAAAQKSDGPKMIHTSSTGAKKMDLSKHQGQSATAPQHQQQSSHHTAPVSTAEFINTINNM
ncbi:yemanuclein isoform X2 [Toxorhynchites rutilus septentrionalis]|uniref:yemanuclein isoform X2 n=1 Tax=Toxorhynchites rutilus septentrionalis TaxID=329112 RepID=UPI002479293A|nr:yemanuclein isoform X2 [Toxorhynchites rutilus septentrionalis]